MSSLNFEALGASDAQAAAARAMEHARDGRLVRAIAMAETAFVLDPSEPLAATAFVFAYALMGENVSAQLWLDRLGDRDDMGLVGALRYKVARALGKDKEAAEHLARARAANPGDEMLRRLEALRISEAWQHGDPSATSLDFPQSSPGLPQEIMDDMLAGRLKRGFAKIVGLEDGRRLPDPLAKAMGFATPDVLDGGKGLPRHGMPSLSRWDGRRNKRLRLLVICQAGNGDTLQFIRYLPFARRLVGHVTAVVPRSLVPLIEADAVLPLESLEGALRDADAYVSLTQLCALMADGYAVQYARRLRRDPARARPKLPGFHIGVCWGGSPFNALDRMRSTTVEALAPLAAVSDATWHSLQVGPRAAEIAASPVPLIDHADEIKDFGDTRAIIDTLDLVVTIESAAGHLAASIGKPTWMALSEPADWRWERGTRSSWYPSARLFRQRTSGDWASVFDTMAAALPAEIAAASMPSARRVAG